MLVIDPGIRWLRQPPAGGCKHPPLRVGVGVPDDPAVQRLPPSTAGEQCSPLQFPGKYAFVTTHNATPKIERYTHFG